MREVISQFTDKTNETINEVIHDNNAIKKVQETQAMEQQRQNSYLLNLKQLNDLQESKIAKLQEITTDLQATKANDKEFQTFM